MKGLVRALLVFSAGIILLGASAFFARKTVLDFLGPDLLNVPLLHLQYVRKVLAAPPKADLLILGDSTAVFSVDAAAFPSAQSLATTYSTTVEAYYTARKAMEAGIAPRCMLFSFSFSWKESAEHFWPVFVLGGLLDNPDLQEIRSTLRGRSAVTPVQESFLFEARRLLYQNGILDGFTWSSIRDALLKGATNSQRAAQVTENLQHHKGSNPISDKTRFAGNTSLVYEHGPELSPQQKLYLSKLVELARERKIDVFFLALPFAASVESAYAEGFWKKYFQVLDETLSGSSAGIRRIQPAPLPPHMYLGAGHLNEAGVAKIQPQLLRETAGCFRGGRNGP